jgi:hypothetical protein
MKALYSFVVAVVFVVIWGVLSFYFAFPEIFYALNDVDAMKEAFDNVQKERVIVYYNHAAIVVLIGVDYVYSLLKKYGGVTLNGVYTYILGAIILCFCSSIVAMILMHNVNINFIYLCGWFVVSVVLAKFLTLFTPHELIKV